MLAVLPGVLYLGLDVGPAAEVLPVEDPRGAGLPTALRAASYVDGWGVAAGETVVVGDGAVHLPVPLGAVRTWRPPRVRAVESGPLPRRLLVDAAEETGLGPGLTPEADDVLCGLLLVARATGSPTAELVGGLRGRTTDLSWSLIRAAAAGHGVAAVVRAADLLLAGHPLAPAQRDAVIALGHTSGAALLRGLCLGVAALTDGLPESLTEGRAVA